MYGVAEHPLNIRELTNTYKESENMNDNTNTNTITDWLKQHGADSVEPTQEGYHCIAHLFSYTIQEHTVVSLMEHEGTNKPLTPISSDGVDDLKTNDLLVSNMTPISSFVSDIGRRLDY